MRRERPIVIAGGGTGGHVHPGLALARELRRRRATVPIEWIGTLGGLEERLVPPLDIPLVLLPLRGAARRGLVSGLAAGWLAFTATLKLVARFARLRPVLAIGVGGFASGPAILAALLLGVPTLLVEPNAVPGRTNRALAPFAGAIAVGFEICADRLSGHVVVTGNPVREEISAIPPRSPGPLARIVSFGGSRGARAISDAWVGALAALAPYGLRFDLQAAAEDRDRLAAAAEKSGARADIATFFDDLAERLADADLVVARAGASTVAELAAAGRASILIPYPFAADDHQLANARTLEDAGGAIVIESRDFDATRLTTVVRSLAGDPERLDRMARAARRAARPHAVRQIADLAVALLRGHS